MNNIFNKKRIRFSVITLASTICGSLLFSSCEDFLEPKPLSFFEPEATFTTESGLQATLFSADRQFFNHWIHSQRALLDMQYRLSDLAVGGKTDDENMFCNIDGVLTPTSMPNQISWFWEDVLGSGVKFANTILTYIDNVKGLDENVKKAYIGRALFHRSFRYLNLAFQFKDVPFMNKIVEVPKVNFYSTKREVILEAITKDMEQAVEWVPEQKDMEYTGLINKGACRQLLIKCYLATGQWEKAAKQADILINDSGYELMQEPFGTFVEGGEPETWKITRNVIWDLHRPENKLISANKEVILGFVNRGSGESFETFTSMRSFGPFWADAKIKGPDGKPGTSRIARTDSRYNKKLNYLRAIGRGIADIRATYFATHTLWKVNGVEDKGDLRHNSSVGNWFPMDSLKYNDPSSAYYGKTYAEVMPDYSQDTVRTWFDFPHYKIYLKDVVNENNPSPSEDFQGATKGAIADWYVFRLAETYLLRAEAKFYMGDVTGAAADVNEVRKRAHCEQLYETVTIGDIVNERARELYLEEHRHTELSRISYCLALSGKPDEWGNVYDVNTYDKQSGTDLEGGSYWYQRIMHYNGFYNKTPVNANGKVFKYVINKHNLYYPVPNSAITRNTKGQLRQNYGYDGYDENIPMWQTIEEAIADQDRTE